MSLELLLVRDLREAYCTLGIMTVGIHKLHTMERPWLPSETGGKSGRRFESCVSDGTYKIITHRSEKYQKGVWALVNPSLDVYHQPADVPRGREAQARVAILIHPANYWHELVGCIGPGRTRSKNGEWWVASSQDAMNLIKTVIGNRLDVNLTIQWADGLKP